MKLGNKPIKRCRYSITIILDDDGIAKEYRKIMTHDEVIDHAKEVLGHLKGRVLGKSRVVIDVCQMFEIDHNEIYLEKDGTIRVEEMGCSV